MDVFAYSMKEHIEKMERGKVFGIHLRTLQVLFEDGEDTIVIYISLTIAISSSICIIIIIIKFFSLHVYAFAGKIFNNSNGDIANDQYHRYKVCTME